ncbi:MAG: aldose 1-epimerase family protein [Firmicutes bacterium]|nr:aldose 1-epimerase family protein [Bacillota bacterium]
MDIVTLQNSFLTVQIAAMGAEILSVRDALGFERIWQGHPDFWSKHAPILFPVAGVLKENAYRLEGKRYALSRHGFARERLFTVEQCDDAGVTFLLAGPSAAHEGFPFEYTLRARYILSGNTLTARTVVENLDKKPLWYSAGSHEAYACPGGVGQCEIVFDQMESLAHSRLRDGLLTGETVPVEMDGRTLRLQDAHFANDTLVLASLKSRSVTLRSRPHPRRVRIDFPDFDYLLLWTNIGAEFLCVEPWHNLSDRIDTDQELTRKPGMIRVNPGASSTLTHALTFE